MSDNHPNGPLGPTLDDEIEKLRALAVSVGEDNLFDPEIRALQAGDDYYGLQKPVPISETLVERAPEQMPAIVRSMHHTAAQALDDAAHHLEQEMQSCLALMRETAEQLRTQGDNQASTIQLLATLIRDTHTAFRSQADKLAKFRSGSPE